MPTASPGCGEPAEDAEEKTDGASGSPGEETWKDPGWGRKWAWPGSGGLGEQRCAAHAARDLPEPRAAAEGVVLFAASPMGTLGGPAADTSTCSRGCARVLFIQRSTWNQRHT
ncbi:unnamed protein product [Rangifer tarandus platyrhynchus]|uniref:Uncharacterized protein n=2 Tax=Rangifer tarandus platyrhynchus TaxID=3082113 RepID=A0ABN8ZCS8_RANTA|nr:unnamed protein product [Rangifer tarandus platyrhynchus]CAI9707859.1 unnamed protein product [Rangifer tarandus platyrhynchus]